MVYYFKPAVQIAYQYLHDGTDWVKATGLTTGEQKIVIQGDNVGLATEATLAGKATEATLSAFSDKFSVVTASGSISAASNTAGYELTLDCGARKLVHWHVVLGGAGEAKVQVSDNGTDWYDTANSTSLAAAGSWNDWDFIGFRYVKVIVPTTGIDVTIVISAKP